MTAANSPRGREAKKKRMKTPGNANVLVGMRMNRQCPAAPASHCPNPHSFRFLNPEKEIGTTEYSEYTEVQRNEKFVVFTQWIEPFKFAIHSFSVCSVFRGFHFWIWIKQKATKATKELSSSPHLSFAEL
jgi:hypothetical protein